MKTQVASTVELTPEALALVLCSATPEEFSSFWFHFSKNVKDAQLKEFAKPLSAKYGGLRLKALRRLSALTEHQVIQRELDGDDL